MSIKNHGFIDSMIERSAYLGRRKVKAKAYAKKAVRRQERHQGKSLVTTELKLIAEDARAAMTGHLASNIKIGFDTRKRHIAKRLEASLEQFRAFAEQQCIPLKSLAEVNAETTWAPPRNRTTFEIESNGTKLVLASCAL